MTANYGEDEIYGIGQYYGYKGSRKVKEMFSENKWDRHYNQQEDNLQIAKED